MIKKSFAIFGMFLWVHVGVVSAEQSYDTQKQTWLISAMQWVRGQESRVYRDKMCQNAKNVIGPVCNAYTMSQEDRACGKKILLALRDGTPIDLNQELKKCHDSKAVIEMINSVYQHAPYTGYYIISNIVAKACAENWQQLNDTVVMMVKIYQLPNDQRLQLIAQLEKQNRYDEARGISMIGNMSERKMVMLLMQLHKNLNEIKKRTMQNMDVKRWREDHFFWLATCAQALESATLPTANSIKEREQAGQQWKDLCNGVDKIRAYDNQVEKYRNILDMIVGIADNSVVDRVKTEYEKLSLACDNERLELSALEPGWKLLDADKVITKNEITHAYKRAFLKYHPDKVGEAEKLVAGENFKNIGLAKDYKLKYPTERWVDVQKKIALFEKNIKIINNHICGIDCNLKKIKSYYSQETLNNIERHYFKDRAAALAAILMKSPVRPPLQPPSAYYPLKFPK